MGLKTVFTNKWISVKETDNEFFFFERNGKDSIALFLLKQENDKLKVLVRFQPIPVGDKEYGKKLYPCPITGGLYEDLDPKTIAIKEAKEEAGFDVEDKIEYLGKYHVGTQTSETVFIFVSEVTDLIPEEPKGDGTYFESISKNEWRDFLELKDYDYSACKIGFYLILDRLSPME